MAMASYLMSTRRLPSSPRGGEKGARHREL